MKIGDVVKVRPECPFQRDGRGWIVQILKADRYSERRARVRFSVAFETTIAVKYLEPAE
jgi:hypothetical protein